MKMGFQGQCIGYEDKRACQIPFAVELAYPRTSSEFKAARYLTGQTDAYFVLCPYTQFQRMIEWLREYHPHADHQVVFERIRAEILRRGLPMPHELEQTSQ